MAEEQGEPSRDQDTRMAEYPSDFIEGDDDDDAMLQAAITASLTEQHEPSDNAYEATRSAAAGPIRTNKTRSLQHRHQTEDAGSSSKNYASAAGSSSGAQDSSGRRQNRPTAPHQTDHSSSGTTSRLTGWNDHVFVPGAPHMRHAAQSASQRSTPHSTSDSSASNGLHESAALQAQTLRTRTNSSMSIDPQPANEVAARARSGSGRGSSRFVQNEDPHGNNEADDSLDEVAMLLGPSGARARRRSQQALGGAGGRRSFGSGSGSGTPITIASSGPPSRNGEPRSPPLGYARSNSRTATRIGADDSVEFVSASYAGPSSTTSRTLSRGGGSAPMFGRSLDNDVDLLPASYGSGSAQRSPFLHPSLRNQDLDDIEDDPEVELGDSRSPDDFEITGSRRGQHQQTSAHASAGGRRGQNDAAFAQMVARRAAAAHGVTPSLSRSGSNRPVDSSNLSALHRALSGADRDRIRRVSGGRVDGDLDEAFGDDDDYFGEDPEGLEDDDRDPVAAALDHMRAMQSYLSAGGGTVGAGGHAARNYDDEDEALQAALAASLAETGGDGTGAMFPGVLIHSGGHSELPEGYDPDAFEAQANAAAQAAAARSPTPPPQDVERIARMREEARRKDREEQDRAERKARGEVSPPPAAAESESKKPPQDADEDDDDDDDDKDDQPEEVVSAEEMRRRRLARFNT
ncbi:hypothetical protein OC846_000004 [Tilletia horrida]|uniref:Uncharacterized protein n=1 Tax=Tilletia horrida TaxID=155126 RepID=A0AAN6GWE8_9BASI|nr:hypothetical protein OC845_001317 [Tilletia horrida]KAK0558012.1 hypothetical protein OC846_000004 [Tilletia horrida]KAK0569148.1 hypothetical protein OC861_001184 [Tilletia horrida]